MEVVGYVIHNEECYFLGEFGQTFDTFEAADKFAKDFCETLGTDRGGGLVVYGLVAVNQETGDPL